MKIINTLSNPAIVNSFFMLIIFAGKEIGGPYAMYVYFTIKDRSIFSLLAIAGILTNMIGYTLENKRKKISGIITLLAALLDMLSIIVFLQYGGKSETFKQLIPLSTIVVFAILWLCLIARGVVLVNSQKNDKGIQEIQGF